MLVFFRKGARSSDTDSTVKISIPTFVAPLELSTSVYPARIYLLRRKTRFRVFKVEWEKGIVEFSENSAFLAHRTWSLCVDFSVDKEVMENSEDYSDICSFVDSIQPCIDYHQESSAQIAGFPNLTSDD